MKQLYIPSSPASTHIQTSYSTQDLYTVNKTYLSMIVEKWHHSKSSSKYAATEKLKGKDEKLM